MSLGASSIVLYIVVLTYMVYSSWTEPKILGWPKFFYFSETLLPLSTKLQDVPHQILDLYFFN